MESRAILAFVLSLLVFGGWNYFLESQQDKKAANQPSIQAREKLQTPQTTQPKKTEEPGIPSLPKVTPQPAAQIQPSHSETKSPLGLSQEENKTEKDITITLKNSEIVLTTRGAGIKSFKMNKYKNHKGNPLELIKTSKGNIPSPQIILEDNNISMFAGRSIYETSTDHLVLSESNPTGKIIFRLKDASGLEIIKEYDFQFDSYKVNCSVDMRYGNVPLKYVRFSWKDGVSSGKEGKDVYTYEGPTTLVGMERSADAEELEEGPVRHSGKVKWTAYQNKYFAIALIPLEKEATVIVEKGKNDVATVGLEYGLDSFPFKKEFSFFLGPKESEELDRFKDISLGSLIDYGWFGNFFGFLVKPLFNFLQYFYRLTGNYGWSIIFLTVIIKVLFFPLSHKSFKSMKNMQKLQPEIKILQERYKNDRQMLSQEMMRIYKENKVNPLGGCLPMLLQIPVFISLYHVLLISIELRNAPFALWITDLSEKDPFYVTPLLMGASMFLQQKMTPSMGDPAQQKIMMILPVVFTFLFLNFPSGLVIYWLINNILTIGQQFYIHKFSK